MTEPSVPRIRAEGVSVEKGGRAIVRDVSVAVDAGEVLGVLGPSGAGKSTFFGALVGEEPMSAGRVELEGRDVSRLPLWQRVRRGIGYIPQSPSVLWGLTVRDNFRTFVGVVRGTRATEDDVREASERVGLAERLDVTAGALSGGERRRLELGRALTTAPRVLICDEPFAGVDPRGAARLGELCKGSQRPAWRSFWPTTTWTRRCASAPALCCCSTVASRRSPSPPRSGAIRSFEGATWGRGRRPDMRVACSGAARPGLALTSACPYGLLCWR